MEGITATLDDYQVEGVRFGIAHHYCLIADEQGLGKTLEAIAVALSTSKRILVVCPAFLKTNWRREFNKFSTRPLAIVEFVALKDPALFDPELCFADVVLVTYEQVKYAEQVFYWADCIVGDECQKLKKNTTQRTIFFDRYLYESECPRLILLSGTPLENRVEELYTILTFLSYSPHKTNGVNVLEAYPSLNRFCLEFSYQRKMRVRGRTVIKWDGLRNSEGLRALLRDKMIRRLAANVLGLEAYTEENVVVAYGDDAALSEEWDAHNAAGGVESRAKKNSAVLKARFTAEIVAGIIEDGESVVVFSDHVESAKIVAARAGIPYIDGTVPARKRDELVQKLQSGEVAGLSCTIGAASVGFNMTSASRLVFNDLSWVPAANAQALTRIHRRGQTRKCVITYVVGSRQDEYIIDLLKKKTKIIKEVIGG